MLPIEAIVERLATIPGMIVGTTVFGGTSAMLPRSGAYLTVESTGGRTPWGVQNGNQKVAIRRPSFQIVAHALSYLDAENLAALAYEVLTANDVVIGGIYFLSITPRHEPFALPLDVNQYNRIAFNIDTERRA